MFRKLLALEQTEQNRRIRSRNPLAAVSSSLGSALQDPPARGKFLRLLVLGLHTLFAVSFGLDP